MSKAVRRQKQLDRLNDMVDRAAQILDGLTPARLEELFRRAEISAQPDSLPRASFRDPTQVGRVAREGDDESEAVDLTAVESAAEIRLAGGVRDPIAEAIDGILADITSAYELVRHALERAQDVESEATRTQGRQQATTPCLACLEATAEIAGFCRRCYGQWCNYGRPDRMEFASWRQGKRDAPPRPTTKARRGPFRQLRASIAVLNGSDQILPRRGGRTLQGREVDDEISELRSSGALPQIREEA